MNDGLSSGVVFDHAAIATDDVPQLKKVLSLLGLSDAGSELVESQGVNTHFFSSDSNKPNVEILEVRDPEGVIAKFLKKRGPGIHHICFRVKDVESLSQKLVNHKIRLVYDAPRPGAHGCLVNFIHPASAGGILVEISQKKI